MVDNSDLKKCDTMGNQTPLDMKKTQQSSFLNGQESTVYTRTALDESRLGEGLADASPMKFDNNTGM